MIYTMYHGLVIQLQNMFSIINALEMTKNCGSYMLR